MNKNTIGLAYRARKASVGIDNTISKIRQNDVYLVFIASDASDLTKKIVTDKSKFYNVPCDLSLDSKELSVVTGRKNIMVIGILDEGFAKSIKK